MLRDRVGAERAATPVLRATGYDLHALPTEMVDEREPLALVRAVLKEFGPSHSAAIMREAGQRTAEYLLGNRIPIVAQWVMRLAPRSVGAAILLKAMQSNAWTFAGTELTFGSCAMCRGMLSSSADVRLLRGNLRASFPGAGVRNGSRGGSRVHCTWWTLLPLRAAGHDLNGAS